MCAAILIVGMIVAGIAILPTAIPQVIHAATSRPTALLLVACCWLIATIAAIVGKRIIAAGHLGWLSATTAHVSGTVANRVVPGGVGAAGAFLAALRRGGATRTGAAAVVALWAIAGAVAHASGLVLGVAWFRGGGLALGAVLLLAAVLIATGPTLVRRVQEFIRGLPGRPQRSSAAGGWSARTSFGRRLHAHAKQAVAAVREVIVTVRARPILAAAAVIAQLAALLSLALGFGLAVSSFGVSVTLAAGMAAYVAGTALAATTPTPAGIGSAEAALVGALVIAGAGIGEAVPTVLLFRAVVLVAPVVVAGLAAAGWLAFRWAQARSKMTPVP